MGIFDNVNAEIDQLEKNIGFDVLQMIQQPQWDANADERKRIQQLCSQCYHATIQLEEEYHTKLILLAITVAWAMSLRHRKGIEIDQAEALLNMANGLANQDTYLLAFIEYVYSSLSRGKDDFEKARIHAESAKKLIE